MITKQQLERRKSELTQALEQHIAQMRQLDAQRAETATTIEQLRGALTEIVSLLDSAREDGE